MNGNQDVAVKICKAVSSQFHNILLKPSVSMCVEVVPFVWCPAEDRGGGRILT